METPLPEYKEITERESLTADMVEFDEEQRFLRVVTPSVLRPGGNAVAWLLPIQTTEIDSSNPEHKGDNGFAFVVVRGPAAEKLESMFRKKVH